jgi:uncharacterized protein (TIGR00297 family)
LSVAVALAAWRRGALSPSGSAGAVLVGAAIFGAGGQRGSALLLLFFGSSSALSRLSGADKKPRRTMVQVLANGGVPAVLALLYDVWPSRHLAAAYAGALAAANSDTWATEIGALSKTPPRLITTGGAVERGTSGAITPLGTLASVAGALTIGIACAALDRDADVIWRVSVGGMAGSVADSLLGATLQAVYTCSVCGMRTEDRRHAHGDASPALILTGGVPWMTNDTVNLCASLVGVAGGGLLAGPRQ